MSFTGMRLFSSDRDESPAEAVVTLLWRYEVSEDGGKTWRPETEREERYVLRRGNWVAPPLN